MRFIAERKKSERPVEVRLAVMVAPGTMGLYYSDILVAMITDGRVNLMSFADDSEDQCTLLSAGVVFCTIGSLSYISCVEFEEPAQ